MMLSILNIILTSKCNEIYDEAGASLKKVLQTLIGCVFLLISRTLNLNFISITVARTKLQDNFVGARGYPNKFC